MTVSTHDHDDMLQQGYDPEIIRQTPDLDSGDQHAGLVEVQKFLKHFGYFSTDPVGTGAPPDAGHLDATTVRALVEFQMRYDVGTLGTLDAPTRELMAAPRCGVPDIIGSSVNFATACAWNRRNLSYQFGRPGASAMTTDLPQGVTINAIRRALNSWANAGAGLTFQVITGGDIGADADIRIEWRAKADPDHSMVGNIVAHADFPPGCSAVTTDYPKPLHFDDSETWVDGAVAGGFDIETVALHELGHLLGLKHSDVNGSVMWPYVSSNYTMRTLQPDDLTAIRSLYPAAVAWWLPIIG